MTQEQFNIVDKLNIRKQELSSELNFLLRPETKRYPIIELSYRDFNYNTYSTEIITTIHTLLFNELTSINNQINNIVCSGSL